MASEQLSRELQSETAANRRYALGDEEEGDDQFQIEKQDDAYVP